MTEITVPSGAKVVINPADFRASIALKNALQRELAKSNTTLKMNLNSDALELGRLIMLVDSSPEVNALLWPCLARCTYNDEKITEKTFEPVEARQDYYDIVLECGRVNLSPFFESALSKLKTSPLAALVSVSQKSESTKA